MEYHTFLDAYSFNKIVNDDSLRPQDVIDML